MQVLIIQVIAVTPDPDSRCARARDPPASREGETCGAETDFEEEAAALTELDSSSMPAAHVHGWKSVGSTKRLAN